jgi:hypothetical protein
VLRQAVAAIGYHLIPLAAQPAESISEECTVEQRTWR